MNRIESDSHWRLTQRDLQEGFGNAQIAMYFAWSDVKARYKRSIIGPFWQTLGTLIGVVGLGYVWSALFHIPMQKFIPSLTIGLIIWQLIGGVMIEGCGAFIRQAPIIKNLVQPLSIHPLHLVIRNLVNFSHSFAVFILLAILMRVDFGWETLLAIPAFLLLVVNLTWMAFVFSVLGTRFRDMEYGVTTLMPILFLISPVMFRAKDFPVSSVVVSLNPFTYMIETLRSPLLGHAPPAHYWLVLIGIAVVGWLVAIYVFHRAKLRLPFWI